MSFLRVIRRIELDVDNRPTDWVGQNELPIDRNKQRTQTQK